MSEYFSTSYHGDPFQLFGTSHLVAVGVILAAAAVLIGLGRTGGAERARRMRLALALTLLLNEVGWHLWNLGTGSWTIEQMLPLHMCSAMVWITVWALLLDERRLYPLLYFFGVAGASQALITPSSGGYGFPHYRFVETMLSHGLLVTGGLWVVSVERWRPTPRSLVAVLVGLNAYALVILWVNSRIGSNYLYLAAKPDSASLMDFFPAWPWYLLVLEGLAVAVCVLLYLPLARGTGDEANASSPSRAPR